MELQLKLIVNPPAIDNILKDLENNKTLSIDSSFYLKKILTATIEKICTQDKENESFREIENFLIFNPEHDPDLYIEEEDYC